MIRYLIAINITVFLSVSAWSQTQNDTIFCYKSKTPVIIDGQATEDCWSNTGWHAIDQVWIPWAAKMTDSDFNGRFKVAWDEDFLYMLVEVVDDSLSDDHPDPLQNWWDDDCLEVFIDENRSKGDHERNCNAFAYHVSLFYDAVDLNSAGQGVNYKNNVIADMDTIGVQTYLWEMAFKNYDASFNINNPEVSRVKLTNNKKMGLAVAYCDNDEKTTRENFIGSMVMTQATANDMYKNADHFGLMVLVDPDSVSTRVTEIKNPIEVKLYPVPVKNYLNLEIPSHNYEAITVSISTITGQIMKTEYFKGNFHQIKMDNFDTGTYIIKIIQGNDSFSKIILKK